MAEVVDGTAEFTSAPEDLPKLKEGAAGGALASGPGGFPKLNVGPAGALASLPNENAGPDGALDSSLDFSDAPNVKGEDFSFSPIVPPKANVVFDSATVVTGGFPEAPPNAKRLGKVVDVVDAGVVTDVVFSSGLLVGAPKTNGLFASAAPNLTPKPKAVSGFDSSVFDATVLLPKLNVGVVVLSTFLSDDVGAPKLKTDEAAAVVVVGFVADGIWVVVVGFRVVTEGTRVVADLVVCGAPNEKLNPDFGDETDTVSEDVVVTVVEEGPVVDSARGSFGKDPNANPGKGEVVVAGAVVVVMGARSVIAVELVRAGSLALESDGDGCLVASSLGSSTLSAPEVN